MKHGVYIFATILTVIKTFFQDQDFFCDVY